MTVAEGISWPRAETGKLDLRRKTFDSMAKAYPPIEPLRQLRYIRDKLRSIQLSVGRDGRNRTVLWPFSSKTSRTQPKAKHWIFSPSSMVAISDQTGTREGARLHRLFEHGIRSGGGFVG